jgi:dTDP-4-dehydrorhamnose 3,5-epimerase-like enzyme
LHLIFSAFDVKLPRSAKLNMTDSWAPEVERCARWDDPKSAIPWPLNSVLSLSTKDALGSILREG